MTPTQRTLTIGAVLTVAIALIQGRGIIGLLIGIIVAWVLWCIQYFGARNQPPTWGPYLVGAVITLVIGTIMVHGFGLVAGFSIGAIFGGLAGPAATLGKNTRPE